eukprot:scaffold175276_cov17-Tisochrysis_lutea.AAC.2
MQFAWRHGRAVVCCIWCGGTAVHLQCGGTAVQLDEHRMRFPLLLGHMYKVVSGSTKRPGCRIEDALWDEDHA